MKYLLLLLIACASLTGLFFFYEEPPLTEKNVFHSRVARDYFAAQGYEVPKTAEEAKLLNQTFIEKMRASLDPEPARKMFLGADLKEAYQEFLYGLIPPYKEGDFGEYLETSLKALKANPAFKKTKTTLSNDSYAEGNFPFLQFVLPNGTKVIRMGLPMREQGFLKSFLSLLKINPEFLQFVNASSSHLYINLMKRTGLEGPYSKALENLDRSDSKLAVVTLDKNTDFYWQEGEFPSESSAFKELFYQTLLKSDEGFYWSTKIDPDTRKKMVGDSLDQVHQIYFHGKNELSLEERQSFIELVYLEILDHLVDILHPETMNITCKHAIDRAPSLAVLWQFKQMSSSENETAALLLAPPLLMHNRTSHESRLKRFNLAYAQVKSKIGF